ncbi:MAG: Fe-Mn family superoxide dismutase [Pirellulaceae bacterium]|nr:Fe-Mn family superoxide dismutase [Pirellulaceae bacterium]
MSDFSRRAFLFASSGAAAGSMLVSSAAGADDDKGGQFSGSGLVTGAPKPLRHTSIPGFLSAEQIAPHHTAHYGGALRGYSAADAKLEESIKADRAIDSSAYGAMQRARQSKGNSVVLHELYFDGLAPKAPAPKGDVRKAIEKRFGSLEKWAGDFQASAKTAAGWAMLVVHPVNGQLYNVVSDEHAQGPLWMAVPLVVIDVYEHAFYIDYHNRKTDYVAKFMSHIDWSEVNARYRLAT